MEKLIYSGSPHIRGKSSTKRIMIDVLIALLPACITGVCFFGPRALLVLASSVVSAVASEFAYNLLINRKSFKNCAEEFDFTSVVTGLLLGMNLAPAIDWYVPVLSAIFAVVVVKMMFGGTGKNLFNPAIAGRVFAFISFSAAMTKAANFASGSIVLPESGATPLTQLLNNGNIGDYTLLQMFLGNTPGCIGETSALAILAGGLYLVVRGVIDIRYPLLYLGSLGLISVCFAGFDFSVFLPSILGGGAMLCAFFMATDYVTTPDTVKGNVIYFIALGILTGILRYSKTSDKIEAVSFALMMMNITVPLIDKFVVNKPFGYVKVRGKKEKEAKQ